MIMLNALTAFLVESPSIFAFALKFSVKFPLPVNPVNAVAVVVIIPVEDAMLKYVLSKLESSFAYNNVPPPAPAVAVKRSKTVGVVPPSLKLS